MSLLTSTLRLLHSGSPQTRTGAGELPPPGAPPPWRRLLPVALLGLLVATLLVGARMGAPDEFDPIGPFVVGHHTGIDAELRERGLPVAPADQLSQYGYDGQWFLGQALDPLLRTDIATTFDAPRYRALRVMLPAAGWLLGAGQPGAIPYALLLVGALSVALGCAATGRIAAAYGRARWWGLSFAAIPGVVVGVAYGTAEPLGLALAALGISLALERRALLAGLAFAGAALTKENYLAFALIAAGFVVVHGYLSGTRGWWRAAIALAAPGAALLAAWWLYVAAALPPDNNPHGTFSRFSPPLVGWFELLASIGQGVFTADGPMADWPGASTLIATLLLLLAAVGVAGWQRASLPAYLALGWGLYGLVIAGFLLERFLSAQRALGPAVLAAIVLLCTARYPRTPDLAGRVLRRARRELAGLRRTTLRTRGGPSVTATQWPHRPLPRRLRLTDPAAALPAAGGGVALRVADPTALVQLAAAGLITGELRRLNLRMTTAGDIALAGLRPPRPGRHSRRFSWRRHGRYGLRVDLAWSRPYPAAQAMSDLLAAVTRARAWDQTSGPVYALDRSGWHRGADSWPQGRLVAAANPPDYDDRGRPLGPFLPAEPPPADPPLPLVAAVANPYGRRLVGAATRYRLTGFSLSDRRDRRLVDLRRPDQLPAALLRGTLDKYAVVSVTGPVPADPFLAHGLRTLAACGMVFASTDPAVRARLAGLALTVVESPDQVADLPGYQLSVAAARRMAITGDAALRRTALGGDGAVPLPTVTAVVASKRPDDLPSCLRYLAAQRYPALEVVVGLHGYDISQQTRRAWGELLPGRLRLLSFADDLPFGAVLGQLSRAADGELLTKLDDDDHYGPDHLTDLVIAWHSSGADLTAKGARFVYLPERGETIDRAWAAPEVCDVTPAGGAMLLSRSTLQQVGGWSHAPKHVDADLLARVRAAGGVTYRTHGLEYVYVRRSAGHTFVTPLAELLAHGERAYPGLPTELMPGHGDGSRPGSR
ncbi:glycosyltransferase family 2 protein [Natronosporangium hydrolyticum]|uniref:Glycosyltransferase family 2 protein n=1 Tax=Natronosporangium hydrolyticum TaxID=2811111 RepID=A0A895YDH7_9ACTN|nr:glycosyltransferase family 2 protein [Natronosporangium hydrolyticum]QSB14245.1 glycosyltransferase family 2 protein [Natronosporangium hydrolyticum]